MARIAGIDVPDEKRVPISLTYIYGIGRSNAEKIIKLCNIDPSLRMKDLSAADLTRIRAMVEGQFTIEGELRKRVNANVKRLREIKCYRGIRHARGLPVRGQRTRTNARTRKGKR